MAKYKYLGDHISRNGSSKDNVESRMKKVKQTTRAISTCGSSEIMQRMELRVLMKLHETVTIPALLVNCEAWCLNKTEMLNMEMAETWALKRLLNLPRTTPTVAVRFVTGTLFVKLLIQIKQ